MGALEDVAPTILDLLSLPVPNAMTGHSLLVRA
jgi:2,3-bisphosphoglycerate-independent phosphoglycerate mutase